MSDESSKHLAEAKQAITARWSYQGDALFDEMVQLVAGWMDTAAFHCRNEEYYRGLLFDAAKHLGGEAYVCDDGTRSEDPLVVKVPPLVALAIEHRNTYSSILRKCAEILGEEAYVEPNGAMSLSPILPKIPDMIASLMPKGKLEGCTYQQLWSDSMQQVDTIRRWRDHGNTLRNARFAAKLRLQDVADLRGIPLEEASAIELGKTDNLHISVEDWVPKPVATPEMEILKGEFIEEVARCSRDAIEAVIESQMDAIVADVEKKIRDRFGAQETQPPEEATDQQD